MKKEIIYGMLGCAYLFTLSVQDMRRKSVSGIILVVGGVMAVVSQIILQMYSVEAVFGGFIAGCVFCGISWITKEALGYGDSFLIMIIGISIGIWNLIYVLFFAFFFASVCSIGILIKDRFSRKKGVPFVPFLSAGYVVFFLLEVL